MRYSTADSLAISAALRMGTATMVKEQNGSTVTYKFNGQLFFASINSLVAQFDYKDEGNWYSKL